MKNYLLALVSTLFFSYGFAQTAEHAANELIVKFKPQLEGVDFDSIPLSELNDQFEVKEIRPTGNILAGDAFVLHFKKDIELSTVIEAYMSTGLFLYAEPNYIARGAGKKMQAQTIPTDLLFSRQYGLHNDGTFALSPATVDADVDMDLAWDIEQGSSSIVVAVLDAGGKMDHPEFSGRILQNNDAIDGQDNDGNGYIDDQQGWDFINNDNDPTDDHGHGTNVAGITVANGNNGVGYAGVDWNCKLIVGKVLNASNFGTYAAIAEGVHYCVDNGAHVINMSLGGAGQSQLMSDAIQYAYDNDVTVVVSMMNENNNIPYYPAAYSTTIAVGSTDPDDTRTNPFFWNPASGSCFGNHIDVIAPGNFIYGLSHTSNSNYNSYWGGTSQAAPLVAGICTLLLSQDPTRKPDDIKAILHATAEDQVGDPTEDTQGFDIYYGHGRVNAHQALLYSSVSLEESVQKDPISVYPNPASQVLHIEGELQIEFVQLINVLGQVVLHKEYSDQTQIELQVQNLTPGVYSLTVRSENGGLSTQKVVVE